ncbi:MAG: hypothetical protein U1F67_07705 [Rubrivivax sp.]
MRLPFLDTSPSRPLQREFVLLVASILLLLGQPALSRAGAGRPRSARSFGGPGLALVAGLIAINFRRRWLLAWGRLFRRPSRWCSCRPPAPRSSPTASAPSSTWRCRATRCTRTGAKRASHQPAPGVHAAGGRSAAPAWLPGQLPLAPRRWPRALAWRTGSIALALVVLVGAIWAAFQPLSFKHAQPPRVALPATPGNVLWSAAVVARGAKLKPAAGPLLAVGTDAKPGPTLACGARSRVVVLVVGETARAANWGLNGYARQTTPEP